VTHGVRNAIVGAGGLVLAAAAFGAYTLSRGPAVVADVSVIAHGEEVDLASHLSPGKHTVFDFYAIWCPPCRKLSPALERLAARHPNDLAVRKVDIVDWTMPVARQHGIESLPHLILFDREGRKTAEGEEVFDALDRLFGDAASEVNQATVESQPDPGQDSGAAPPATSL
jgi:thiol-disulfide isomerase/thioredoxin